MRDRRTWRGRVGTFLTALSSPMSRHYYGVEARVSSYSRTPSTHIMSAPCNPQSPSFSQGSIQSVRWYDDDCSYDPCGHHSWSDDDSMDVDVSSEPGSEANPIIVDDSIECTEEGSTEENPIIID